MRRKITYCFSRIRYLCLLMLLITSYSSKAVIYTVGTGTTSITTSGITPFGTLYEDGRMQYVYLASELTAAGAGAGFINSFGFNFTSLGSPNPGNVNIKIGTTSDTVLTGLSSATMTIVYTSASVSPTTGWNNYTFSNPFLWNGTDNIIIEVCFDNTSWSGSYGVEVTSFGSGSTRSYGFYDDGVSGCSMTSGNVTSATNRQNRPNAQFDITAAVACSGTPTTGTLQATDDSVCAGENFSLSLVGSTNATGLMYQWESSASGMNNWMPILGANSVNYSGAFTASSSDTDYRCVITCLSSGLSDTSTVVMIHLNTFYYCYCTPVSNCTNEGILNVTFGSLNNTSVQCLMTGGYSNYDTVMPQATFTQGQQAGISVTAHINSDPSHAGVWIDYDHSGTFDASEYTLIGTRTGTFPSGGTSHTFTNNVNIPASAMTGTTRMRVRSANQNGIAPTSACITSSAFGELEDYLIVINAGTPCTGTPTGGTANTSVSISNCPVSVVLSASGYTGGVTGLSFQWEESINGVNFTPRGTPTIDYKNDTVTSIAQTMYYRLAVSCGANTGYSSIDTTVIGAINTFPFVYDVETQNTTTNSSIINDCWSSSPTGTTGSYRWDVDASGSTPSSSTGPSGAYSGNKFYYTEASSGSQGDSAYLMTPLFDLSSLTVPQLVFYYHMYGQTMGNLIIEINSGSGWVTLDSLIGQQQTALSDPWLDKKISLAGYTGVVQLRFVGIRGSNFYSDMSLDDITIRETPTCMASTLLTAGNVTDTSADLSWTPVSFAPSWQVEYGTTGFTQGMGNDTIINTPFITITGLLPLTSYDYYVRDICAPGDTSLWAGPFSFTTLCASVNSFPWTYDVETQNTTTNSNIADCWSSNPSLTTSFFRWDVDASASTPSSSTGPSGAYSGNKFYYTEGSSGTQGDSAYLMTPMINLTSLTVPQLVFYYHMYGAGMGSLIIEIDAGSGWVALDSIIGQQQTALADPWLDKKISLAGYTGTVQLRFIGIRGNALTSDMSLDDITIRETPTCMASTLLTAGNITDTSADLSWTPVSFAATWQVEYGPTGFIQGTGMDTMINTSFVSVSGLMPITGYDYYVRDICSPGDTSFWAGPYTFTTLCPFYTPFYGEGFASFLPSCWEEAEGVLGTASTLTSANGAWGQDDWLNATANGKAAKINLYNTGDADWLISPSIDLGTSGNYMLEFDVAFLDFGDNFNLALGSDDTVAVVVSTDNGQTWDLTNALYIWTASNSSFISQHVMLPLTSYAGIVKIGFYGSEGATSGNDVDVMIDSFVVQLAPSCFQPTILPVSNITASTADISWTPIGTPIAFEVEYDTIGFTLGTGMAVSPNPVLPFTTLTGLSPNTSYEYYVRAICGVNDSSTWSGPHTFTTACGVINSFPWVYDVETQNTTTNSSIGDCWLSNPTGTTGAYRWDVDASASTPSSNTGPSGAYSGSKYYYTEGSSGSQGDSAFLMTPMIDVTSLASPELSFFYHMYGAGMGNLIVEVNAGSGWVAVDSLIGAQQTGLSDPWLEKIISLSGYSGIIQIRFVGMRGNALTSDMSIDDISMREAPAPCTGTPVAGTATADRDTLCVSGDVHLSLTGYDLSLGIQINWQSSPAGLNTFADILGANADTFTVVGVSANTDFRARVTCTSSSMDAYSDTLSVTITNPQVLMTIPGERCDSGSLALYAAGDANTTIKWYDSLTGGSELGTGNVFITPSLNTTDTFYAEPVTEGGTSGASPLIITEIDVNTDQIEIQNVSGEVIDVTGWKVFLSDNYSNINAVNSIVQTLSGNLNPGDILAWTDGGTSTGVSAWGNNILWNPGGAPTYSGWAAIIDNNNILQDVVFMNWSTIDIQTASWSVGTATINPGSKWIGNGVDITSAGTGTISRHGNLDNDDLNDFVVASTSTFASTNTIMTIPFSGFGCAGTRVPVPAIINTSASGTGLADGGTVVGANHADGATVNYNSACNDKVVTVTDASGGNVLGATGATVIVASSVQSYNGAPYVPRIYDIDPASNGAGTVTIYALQSEFNAYNTAATAAGLPLLPTSATDAAGIANIVITQYHGGALDGTTGPGGLYDTTGNIEYIPNSAITVTAPTTSNPYWAMTFPVSGFSGFFIHSGNGPLPIRLTSIAASNHGAKNRVDWMMSEIQEGRFELERSADGSKFGSIAMLPVIDGQRSYSYWDNDPVQGLNYYRLKMIEANGKHSYSDIVTATVGVKGGFDVVAYPNPAKDNLTVEVYGTQGANAQVQVMDVTGKLIKVIEMDGVKTTISLDGMASGVYLMKYADDNQTRTIRVTKE